MPRVKYFDYVRILVDPVVDQDWTMKQFADLRPFWDRGAHAREAGE
jgi:hypothetical protein